MAKFSENYEVENDGGVSMNDGGTITGLGGFATGAILGGLVGWAFGGGYDGFGRYGYPYPMPVQPMGSFAAGVSVGENLYSTADVANLVATKDAQYAQLNATQQTEFNVLSQLYKDNTNLASAICDIGYENARLANQTQGQIAAASAKADLCCCQTQGAISKIVPELKQFYLEDEVAKLRNINAQQNTQCGFDKVNMNLCGIGEGVKAILAKLYNTTTTATTTP